MLFQGIRHLSCTSGYILYQSPSTRWILNSAFWLLNRTFDHNQDLDHDQYTEHEPDYDPKTNHDHSQDQDNYHDQGLCRDRNMESTAIKESTHKYNNISEADLRK